MADKTFGRLTRGGVRPDLAGSHGIGRSRDWNPITVERQLAEQVGYFINGLLRRAVPGIKVRVITERLSAPHVYVRKKLKDGTTYVTRYLVKNPLSAGLRKVTGKAQRSLRITVTSPGTNASRFRGVFTLSSKIGGGDAAYVGIHEGTGRLQFGRVTGEEYAKLIAEIRTGVAQIAAQFGGRVA